MYVQCTLYSAYVTYFNVLHGSSDPTGHLIERVASDFNQLQFYVTQCKGHPLVEKIRSVSIKMIKYPHFICKSFDIVKITKWDTDNPILNLCHIYIYIYNYKYPIVLAYS